MNIFYIIFFLWITCGIIVFIKTIMDGYKYSAWRIILGFLPLPFLLGPIGFLIYKLTGTKKNLFKDLSLVNNNRYKILDI